MAARSAPTKPAAPSGPSPSSSRRTRAEPTTTPSAPAHTSAACSGVDTPMPMHTGRVGHGPEAGGHLPRPISPAAARSPVTPMTPTP